MKPHYRRNPWAFNIYDRCSFTNIRLAEAYTPDALGSKRYAFFKQCAKFYPSKDNRLLPQSMTDGWNGGSGELFFPIGCSDRMFVIGWFYNQPSQLVYYVGSAGRPKLQWTISLPYSPSVKPPKYAGTLMSIIGQAGCLRPKRLSANQAEALDSTRLLARFVFEKSAVPYLIAGTRADEPLYGDVTSSWTHLSVFPTTDYEKKLLRPHH